MIKLILLDVLWKPLEAIAIAHLAHNAAHEDLQRPNVGFGEVHFALAGGEVGQPQVVPQLLLRRRVRFVDLVSQDEEGDVRQGIVGEQGVQLLLRLRKPLLVEGIDQVHHRVHLPGQTRKNPSCKISVWNPKWFEFSAIFQQMLHPLLTRVIWQNLKELNTELLSLWNYLINEALCSTKPPMRWSSKTIRIVKIQSWYVFLWP